MIVEDGIVDALRLSDQFGGGPVRAIQEFLGTQTLHGRGFALERFLRKERHLQSAGLC